MSTTDEILDAIALDAASESDRVVLADLGRTTAKPRKPDTVGGAWFAEHGCLCSHCREPLKVGDLLRQQCIYKCGRLSYIALAHAACAPEYDNAGPED